MRLPELVLRLLRCWTSRRDILGWRFWNRKQGQRMRGTTRSWRRTIQRVVVGVSASGLGWLQSMWRLNRMLLVGLLGSQLLQLKPFKDGSLSKLILFKSWKRCYTTTRLCIWKIILGAVFYDFYKVLNIGHGHIMVCCICCVALVDKKKLWCFNLGF